MTGYELSDTRIKQVDVQESGHLGSEVGQQARIDARIGVLKQEGFSDENIATIQQKVADLNIMIIKPRAGDRISDIASDAVALREETGSAVAFKFTKHVMVAGSGDTAESLISTYFAQIEAEEKKYFTPKSEAEKSKSDNIISNETLPPFLQAWVDSYAGIGPNSGWNSITGYAQDALLVANTLKTPEAVNEWFKLGYNEQIKIVSGYTNAYSGSTFGQMVKLAVAYLQSEAEKV